MSAPPDTTPRPGWPLTPPLPPPGPVVELQHLQHAGPRGGRHRRHRRARVRLEGRDRRGVRVVHRADALLQGRTGSDLERSRAAMG